MDSTLPRELIKKYAPHVYLHSEEPYMPCSVEWFFKNCSMAFGTTNETSLFHEDQLLETVHMDNVTTFKYRHSTYKSVSSHERPVEDDNGWFRLVGNSMLQFDRRDTWLDDGHPPCYYRVSTKYVQSHHVYDIQYMFFYPFNGATFRMCGLQLGAHEGDWEHAVVRLYWDGVKEQFLAIWCSAHGSAYSRWYTDKAHATHKTEEIVQFKDTHPIIYSSWGSHALYNRPLFRHHNQFLCFGGNDASDEGILWDVSQNLVQVLPDSDGVAVSELPALNGQTWVHYGGRWGRYKPSVIWFVPELSESGPRTPVKDEWESQKHYFFPTVL